MIAPANNATVNPDALDGFAPHPMRRRLKDELLIRLPREPYRVSVSSLAKDLGHERCYIHQMLDTLAASGVFILQYGDDVSLPPRHWARLQQRARDYFFYAYTPAGGDGAVAGGGDSGRGRYA